MKEKKVKIINEKSDINDISELCSQGFLFEEPNGELNYYEGSDAMRKLTDVNLQQMVLKIDKILKEHGINRYALLKYLGL